jgi:hypothetical protein
VAEEQGRRAAQHGTDIHAGIEGFYEGTITRLFADEVGGFNTKMVDYFGESTNWIAEKLFVMNRIRRKGRFTFDCGKRHRCRHQNKEFDTDKVDAFDEHLMQLSAYRCWSGYAECSRGQRICFLNCPRLTVVYRTEPERFKMRIERSWHWSISGKPNGTQMKPISAFQTSDMRVFLTEEKPKTRDVSSKRRSAISVSG